MELIVVEMPGRQAGAHGEAETDEAGPGSGPRERLLRFTRVDNPSKSRCIRSATLGRTVELVGWDDGVRDQF